MLVAGVGENGYSNHFSDSSVWGGSHSNSETWVEVGRRYKLFGNKAFCSKISMHSGSSLPKNSATVLESLAEVNCLV